MAELKTRLTGANVAAFIAAVAEPARRGDCRALVSLMTRATGAKAEMWGPSIVGFGRYHYKSSSGREGDWFFAGFSPRKQDLTVYIMGGLHDDPKLLARLGKHKTSAGGCLYLKRLSDVDLSVLETLVERSVATLRALEKSQAKTAKKAVKPAKPKRAAATARPKPARKPARAR